MENKNEMKIEENPFSFQKLAENLEGLEKLFGKPQPSNTVYVQGKNRISVTDTETGLNYFTPSFFSKKGNLCFMLNEQLHFKTPSGYIGKQDITGKWTKAHVTTKAKAQGGK